jgi:hypothetical protein
MARKWGKKTVKISSKNRRKKIKMSKKYTNKIKINL